MSCHGSGLLELVAVTHGLPSWAVSETPWVEAVPALNQAPAAAGLLAEPSSGF